MKEAAQSRRPDTHTETNADTDGRAVDATGMAVTELTGRAGMTLFDLYSPDCAPCRVLAPVLDDLAADFADALRIFKVDVSADLSVAEHFAARSFPTLALYRDGEEIDRIVGLRSRAQLADWIESHL